MKTTFSNESTRALKDAVFMKSITSVLLGYFEFKLAPNGWTAWLTRIRRRHSMEFPFTLAGQLGTPPALKLKHA